AVAEDQVAGENRAILGDQKAQVVGAVARGVDGGEVQRPGTDDVAVIQLRMTQHTGLELARESLGERQVIGMAVRDENDADRLARKTLVERSQVSLVVRTWVDDDDPRTR